MPNKNPDSTPPRLPNNAGALYCARLTTQKTVTDEITKTEASDGKIGGTPSTIIGIIKNTITKIEINNPKIAFTPRQPVNAANIKQIKDVIKATKEIRYASAIEY